MKKVNLLVTLSILVLIFALSFACNQDKSEPNPLP